MNKKWALYMSSFLVGVLFLVAIFAPWLMPNDPHAPNIAMKLQGFSAQYPLGTDHLGRCVLSRLIEGARVSLSIAFVVLVATLVISMVVGLTAGFIGGWLDMLLMRICDILLAIPNFIFALVIVGALGAGMKNLLIAIVLVTWVGFARIIRNMVVSLKETDYVTYARICGVSKWKIVVRHILPFVFPQMLLLKFIGLGSTILMISELSFLGLGVTAPTAEWGMMISESKTYLLTKPELMLIPGIMISITVLIFNAFGDALRDVLDPKTT
ncbi:ABC transporter permease subunit [Lysinibacillus sp. KU-BSD001]|uniref:ABC transporter permease n=1 Tax=Lysinibacillus sp. KU-BSD001 TaxID=3141328 RepID=UPI0036EBC999